MTREELLNHLRNVFTRDGEWNVAAIRGLSPSFWREWIELRLRGDDPWLPYSKDEFPDTAHGLFLGLAEQERKLDLDLSALRAGASAFLASLGPLPEEAQPAHLLLNALDLVARLRVREEDALRTLRDWITNGKLLARSGNPLELHRAALYALAAAQERGNPEDEALWAVWLEPWDGGEPDPADFFLTAAFSGLALSRSAVPSSELISLLKRYREAKAAGRRVRVSPAILALWVGREREADCVRREIWQAMAASECPSEDWATIMRCASRMWPAVRPWPDMVAILGDPARPAPPVPAGPPYRVPRPVRSPWDPGVRLKVRAKVA